MRMLRLVFSTLLAGFGLALSTAGPVLAQEGYRVRPGDVLRVEVIEDESLNRDVLVLPDGTISFPLAGSIRSAGRTLGQVRSTLTAALEPNFASQPNVFVGISRLADRRAASAPVEAATIDIFVLGEANSTGALSVAPGTTVLQAFAQMGGFTNFAATQRVQLRRTDPRSGAETVYLLDYDAIQSGRSPNGQVAVAQGDVILVPQRGLFE